MQRLLVRVIAVRTVVIALEILTRAVAALPEIALESGVSPAGARSSGAPATPRQAAGLDRGAVSSSERPRAGRELGIAG
jgi:hypothetical protein